MRLLLPFVVCHEVSVSGDGSGLGGEGAEIAEGTSAGPGDDVSMLGRSIGAMCDLDMAAFVGMQGRSF